MDRRRRSGGDLFVATAPARQQKSPPLSIKSRTAMTRPNPIPERSVYATPAAATPLVPSVRRAPLERPTDPAPYRSHSLPSRPPSTHTVERAYSASPNDFAGAVGNTPTPAPRAPLDPSTTAEACRPGGA